LFIKESKRYLYARLSCCVLGNIHGDLAPRRRATRHILFPDDGSIDEQLLEMIPGCFPGEIVAFAKGNDMFARRAAL